MTTVDWRLYWHSLHFLSWRQIVFRLFRPLRRGRARFALLCPFRKAWFDPVYPDTLRTLLSTAAEKGATERISLDALRKFQFHYLNRTFQEDEVLLWQRQDLPKLWLYHLHGFRGAREFSMAPLLTPHLGDRDRVLVWMHNWIRHNPPGRGVGWDGWPLSERLISWPVLLAVYHIKDKDIIQSYAQQARWLYHTAEHDLQGNHLLKNALALTLAGSLLEDSRICRYGTALLKAELEKQILPDGGHVERSLLYHNELLWDSLIVLSLLQEAPSFLVSAIRKMASFTRVLCHPDGDIPLFGDASLNESPLPQVLCACADVLTDTACTVDIQRTDCSLACPASGYFLLGDFCAGSVMIVKTAAPSPAHQAAHSHGDMLSYELSLSGKRIIVDTGTHGYAESPYRAHCRSTSAHNVLTPEGREQAEHWSNFRMARRAEALPASLQKTEKGCCFAGAVKYYQGGVYHRRIEFDAQSVCWEICDYLSPDCLDGSPISHIHFHPACTVRWHEPDRELLIIRDKVRVLLTIRNIEYIESSQLEMYSYFPKFGVMQSGTVLALLGRPGEASSWAYQIRWLPNLES